MHFYDQKRLYKLQQYISCFFSYAKWVFARLGWCSLLPLAQCCQVLYEVLSIKKKKIYQMIALLEKKSWNYYGPGKYSMVFLCFVAQFHIIFIFFIGFHLCIGCQKPWMIHEIKCKAPKYLLYKKLIRLYENFSPIMNSQHGCLQKQLMMEHDVSDGGAMLCCAKRRA